MNHKRKRPAKQRAAADCMCNPHQKALGNTRSGFRATREQKRERLIVAEGRAAANTARQGAR